MKASTLFKNLDYVANVARDFAYKLEKRKKSYLSNGQAIHDIIVSDLFEEIVIDILNYLTLFSFLYYMALKPIVQIKQRHLNY